MLRGRENKVGEVEESGTDISEVRIGFQVVPAGWFGQIMP